MRFVCSEMSRSGLDGLCEAETVGLNKDCGWRELISWSEVKGGKLTLASFSIVFVLFLSASTLLLFAC